MTQERALGSNYVLTEIIGRGAMGQVWAGRSTDGSAVAVKLLRDEFTSDPELVARFLQERVVLTGLSHPNLVRVVDLVAEGETLGIVMELIEGADLRAMLRGAGGTLAPSLALSITAAALHGVGHAHEHGITHRDLKPENILVSHDADGAPHPKVSDFGIARLAHGPALTKRSGLIGTPEYMAPEVAEMQHATAAADLYSMGVVLYELLAGRTPFGGGHPVAVLRRHIEDEPPRPDGIDDGVWRVLTTLLAKDPAARPASAAAAAAMLTNAARAAEGLAALPVPAAPEETGDTRHRSQLGAEPQAAAAMTGAPTYAGHRVQPDGHETRMRTDGPPLVAPSGADLAAAPSAPARRQWRGPQRIAAWVGIPAAVLAVAVVAFALPGGSGGTPLQTISHSIGVSEQDGVGISRSWELQGDRGDMVVSTTTVQNLGRAKLASRTIYDVIPASMTTDPDAVESAEGEIVCTNAPLVVAFETGDLEPDGRRTLTYKVRVPAGGRAPARLAAWAKDLDPSAGCKRGDESALDVAALHLEMASTTLSVGDRAPLQVTASTADGSPVPNKLVTGALALQSSNVGVAVADTSESPTVRAVAAGTARITAWVGDVQETLDVTVVSDDVAAGRGSSGDGAVNWPGDADSPPPRGTSSTGGGGSTGTSSGGRDGESSGGGTGGTGVGGTPSGSSSTGSTPPGGTTTDGSQPGTVTSGGTTTGSSGGSTSPGDDGNVGEPSPPSTERTTTTKSTTTTKPTTTKSPTTDSPATDPPAPARSGELVVDPGFESTGTLNHLSGTWRVSEHDECRTTGAGGSGEQPRTGARSLRVFGPSGDACEVYQTVRDIVAGRSYRVGVCVLAPPGSASSVTVVARWRQGEPNRDPASRPIADANVATLGQSGVWQCASRVLTAPSGATVVGLRVAFNGLTGTAYADDATVSLA